VRSEIEVRRLADGRLQAKRLDGRPLTDEDRELARQLAIQNPNKTDIAEGSVIAVLIDSPIVGLLWFAFDDAFSPATMSPSFLSLSFRSFGL
jgi:hypothetical protein